MLLIGLALFLTTKLVQKSQDSRSSAATKCSCSKKAYSDAYSCSKNGGKWTCSTTQNKKPTPTKVKRKTCISFTYTPWSSCTNGKQTREIRNTFPENCTGGKPILKQNCVTVCKNISYSSWSGCEDGYQTRKVLSKSPNDCNSDILIRQRCKPTCNYFVYNEDWTPCNESGYQTRTIKSSSPEGCVNGNPVLKRTCKFVPTPTPARINGFCGTSKNSCDKGTFLDQPDTVNYIEWKCVGSNGGRTEMCKLAR